IQVQLLFLPRAVTFSLPIAVLFAEAYAHGTLYSNNELIAVFGAGVPIWRFTAPLIIFGFILSIGLFFFQEYVVIDTFRQKNEQSRQMLNVSRSFSNTNVTIRSAGGQMIYSAEYYNDASEELSRILILERNQDGQFIERIDAERARWSEQDGIWHIENGTRYRLIDPDAPVGEQEVISEPFTRLEVDRYTMPPQRFRRSGQTIDELRYDEAREWVFGLRDAGQAYRQPLTSYYSRFSFPLTPFIVVLLASGLGGRFRKNVLLMSLFVSLVASVVYYVTGMVAELLAGDAVLPPLVGAWLGVVLFTVGGIAILRTART
nr:LptF/LptG family permease [Spirochaeta sp.]